MGKGETGKKWEKGRRKWKGREGRRRKMQGREEKRKEEEGVYE